MAPKLLILQVFVTANVNISSVVILSGYHTQNFEHDYLYSLKRGHFPNTLTAFFAYDDGFNAQVKRGIELTLSKSKDGPLNVKSIDVYTKNPNKNVTDLERFQCGGFDLGGSKLTKETKQCKTGQCDVIGTSHRYLIIEMQKLTNTFIRDFKLTL